MQGHVMRGFAGMTECGDRLSMEKPIFWKSFTTCHPFGFVAEYYQELGERVALETEIALMNGANGTLDGEHDYNFGAVLYTPLDGFAITGVYNHTAANYYDTATYKKYSKNGYRSIFGAKYENYNFNITGEYVMGKGFLSDKTEMKAYYLQAGYAIPMNFERIQYIQPVMLYEFWDKDSGESTKSTFTYLNAGLNISLNANVKLKMSYRIPQNEPDNSEQEKNFTVRMQMGF
jgi:hypothetical protein